LKPSEVSPHMSNLLAHIIPQYLDNSCIKIIEGGVAITTEILKHKFDHILYTGGCAVAKVVMRAAAEHLCPTTLELGGKNPCFVDSNVELEVAARRIVWGRFFNTGQTCLAPDYVLVKKDFQDTLLDALLKVLQQYYGDNPKTSTDFGRIVNTRHVKRLRSYLEGLDEKDILSVNGKTGVDIDENERYVAPMIIKNIPASTEKKIMQEEIFGPLLPIIPVESLEQAVKFVNSMPHPLTMYIFSSNKKLSRFITEHTHAGSVVVNDTLVHFVQSSIPFGGIGNSGMGAYHGRKSFDTFSHMKPVLDKTTWFDIPTRYPPYTADKFAQARKLMSWL